MLKLAVIGGGLHCYQNHLPALALFMREDPDRIELTAFCDRAPSAVERISGTFPFRRYYREVGEMLRAEQLDGCIAVTPIEATAAVAIQVLEAGIPLLIEKPLGRDLVEADKICKTVEKTGTRAMVSMNRRFDPVLILARDWLKDRSIMEVSASMARTGRKEPSFFKDTAIHAVDALRFLAGEINGYSVAVLVRDNVRSYKVDFRYACGASGILDVQPDGGKVEECYAVAGPGYRLEARTGSEDDGSLTIIEGGEVIHSVGTSATSPGFVKNGTYNETRVFIEALRNGEPMTPSPEEMIASMRICHEIQWAK